MNDTANIFGCFVSATQPYPDANQETKNLALIQGRLFRAYIWGEEGICDTLKKLKHEDYGEDLILILFEFYVNPLPVEAQALKEIGSYRRNEKSIGIPIIISDENFFSKSEEVRYNFLRQAVLRKMEALAELVARRKLDTKIGLLKADLQKNLF